MINIKVTSRLPEIKTDLKPIMKQLVNRMHSDMLDSYATSGYGRWQNTRSGETSMLGGREGTMASSMQKSYDSESATLSVMNTIHQRGGLMKVTDRMRGFFWAKYYETHEDKWKWMALNRSSVMTFPMRRNLYFQTNFLDYAEELIMHQIFTIKGHISPD